MYAGHHYAKRGAVLGAVNALRYRFDRACRAAWRALTAPARSADLGSYVLAAFGRSR